MWRGPVSLTGCSLFKCSYVREVACWGHWRWSVMYSRGGRQRKCAAGAEAVEVTGHWPVTETFADWGVWILISKTMGSNLKIFIPDLYFIFWESHVLTFSLLRDHVSHRGQDRFERNKCKYSWPWNNLGLNCTGSQRLYAAFRLHEGLAP